ncbi:MAG: Ig-like domain-containing protein, partial [Planctomycetaceae bacterium]
MTLVQTQTFSDSERAAVITGRPIRASGEAGWMSKRPAVMIDVTPPTAPTLRLTARSDSGVKGDGRTIINQPVFRGIAQAGRQVSISIDGVVAGRVRSDARTGVWSFESPRLANGVHEITAVATGRGGVQSPEAEFTITVDGLRTMMLDASSGQSVEMMASHVLGGGTQGFIVSRVHDGTLERWSVERDAWVSIPSRALGGRRGLPTDAVAFQNAPAARRLSFSDIVRWTPAPTARGIGPAFDVLPLDNAGGPIAPSPDASTVPGPVESPRAAHQEG